MISFITSLLFGIATLCALLLIGIILIQQSKSGGGLGAISGGMTESVFGAAAGNVITKTTVILASIFLACTMLLAFLSKYEVETETVGDRLRQREQIDFETLDELFDDGELEGDLLESIPAEIDEAPQLDEADGHGPADDIDAAVEETEEE